MEKRRIGNDFKHVWAINWNGLPEDFSDATEIVLTASVFGKKKQLERGIDYVIEGNLIIVDFTPRFATIAGIYNLELKYIKPSDGFIDGERRSAVDIDVVQIVSKSSQVTATGDITSTSEAMIGFQGLSAYEVWLKDNPDKTKEEYYNWLQKPATEIAETVGLQEQARVEAEEQRVLAEELRQTNTATAITNAEDATERANTAAQNADEARLAIQDDLALKANHGYESNPKTLKEVEDDTSVKMTNLLQNSSFENGAISPISRSDGGGVASTLSINTINPISGNYDARLEVTTPGTYTDRPLLRLNGTQSGWVLNHVFYFGMSVKVNSGIPIIIAAHNGAGVNTLNLTLKDGFNSWTVECLGLTNFGVIYLDGRTLWDFNFDNLIAYDLTAIFGEGNEPTGEEMDLLISTLGTDYFEGEITIPAQKIMQWQLALIRKNKNAIIALGGTII